MSVTPTEEVVRTPTGTIKAHVWTPPAGASQLTMVTVHPWATLGGGEHNCVGIACHLASTCGVRVLTFDMLSSWAIWGMLSAHRKEVVQVQAVCAWAHERWGGRVVLFGSSAGAPVAGSAISSVPQVEGLVCIGYTWGFPASIAFGRHFARTLSSPKPKLFVQGEHDEFTHPATLERFMARAEGENDVVVVPGIGHFELESPDYDAHVAQLTMEWLRKKGLAS